MTTPMEVVAFNNGGETITDGIRSGRSRCGSRLKSVPHVHDHHHVTLILSGSGRSEWNFGVEQPYRVRPREGDIVFCPAFVVTHVRIERPIESVSLRIAPEWLDGLSEKTGMGAIDFRQATMRRDRFVGELARKLADETTLRSGAGQELLAASLGTALGIHLLHEYAAPDRLAVPTDPGLADRDLKIILNHIEARMEGDLSLDRLASLVGLTRYGFLRRFRVSMHTTPHQYVIQRRVERARELLEAGHGIAQTAARVGFSSQTHLHHHVRRLLGVTPGQIARRDSGA